MLPAEWICSLLLAPAREIMKYLISPFESGVEKKKSSTEEDLQRSWVDSCYTDHFEHNVFLKGVFPLYGDWDRLQWCVVLLSCNWLLMIDACPGSARPEWTWILSANSLSKQQHWRQWKKKERKKCPLQHPGNMVFAESAEVAFSHP